MNDIRNGWENIDEFVGIPGYGITSVEKFIRGRSVSIYQKVRGIFKRDFIIKSISFLFIIFTLAQINYFGLFKRSADPGRSSRDNLTSLLTFLKRKFPFSALMSASSNIFGFVPGMLLYFILVYGYLKPFQPMAYFVYSFLCLTSMIFSFILDMRQVRYHIKHIRICLSDLNDNALAMASENIESKRKQDTTVIVLTQVVIVLGFIVLIAVLKSIVT